MDGHGSLAEINGTSSTAGCATGRRSAWLAFRACAGRADALLFEGDFAIEAVDGIQEIDVHVHEDILAFRHSVCTVAHVEELGEISEDVFC